MKLKDAAVVVTGGASGLGAAVVRGFRARGAAVTIFDRDADRGAELAQETGAGLCTVDVTDELSVATAIAEAVETMGQVNGLVNCAGIATGARIVGRDGAHDLALFRRTIDINLTGSFNCLRLCAAEMARNAPAGGNADGERGVIVNTASIAAFDGQKGQAAYAASKSAIAGMTLPAARDLASLGIRVNAIAPGVFTTPMLEGLGQEIRDGLAAEVTFPRRLGEPVEFAALAAFLFECAYLNGEVIRLDGALRMR
ncbi:SDR family NAD(P)-dependent oxidoreductase [Szabonella alba]|uniref:SDR family NAD(P)-dependent oxidoreductase n=1 Tax=Szabonella alba TaxID=2804194 RepID=A0A8K0V9E2_9RHOB|nr:SDR family NAD(P)-dependent oxidoreductase [Szabonella alba]MBL4917546.1 SDR family NAD(P)-dependent oxidoreductase [Szabonella alba]